MDKRRKRILAVLAVLLAALLLDLALWYTAPRSVIYTQTGEQKTFTAETISFDKCREENGKYYPNKNRVVLNFTTGRLFGGDIVIRLNEPQNETTAVRLQYAAEDQDFTTDRSIVLRPEKDRSEIRFTLPKGDWNRFRISYHNVLSLKEIVVSREEAEQSRMPWQPNPIRILVTIAAAGFLILIFQLRPIQTAILTFHKRCLDPETRYKAIDWAYFVFALAMLFHHVYVYLYLDPDRLQKTAAFFQIPWYIFAAVSILLGRMWKDKGFWFLLLLLIIQYLRVAVPAADELDSMQYFYTTAIYAFFGCYAVGYAVNPQLRICFLKAFCSIWTAAITFLSVCGLYAVWTGTVVNLGDQAVFLDTNSHSLQMFRSTINSGILNSISLAVTIIGAALCKKKVFRVIFLICVLPILLASALTGCRNGYIITAVEFSLIVCIPLFDRLKPSLIGNRYNLSFKKWMLIFIVLFSLVVLLTLIQPYLVKGFNASMNKRGEILFETAKAEEADNSIPEVRLHDFSEYDVPERFLSGRLLIWEIVFRVLKENPRILLFGESVIEPVRKMNYIQKTEIPWLPTNAHCHNIYLQILLENGIPGLLLYLSTIIYFLIHALRLMKNKDLPLWMRILPIPVFGGMIEGLADITTWMRSGNPQMTLLYLFMGFTVVYSKATDKTKRKE